MEVMDLFVIIEMPNADQEDQFFMCIICNFKVMKVWGGGDSEN